MLSLMAKRKENNLRVSENGKYQCLICDKELSSRQRVLTHLHSKHGLSPVKRVKKLYVDDETLPVPRSTHYWRQIRCRKTTRKFDCNTHEMDLPSTSTGYEYDELDSSSKMRDLRDKVGTYENLQNFQHHELQDVTNTFASDIENTADKTDMVYAVHYCTSKLPMEAESSLSAANNSSEHSNCCEHLNDETQIQSVGEYDQTSSVASDNSLSDTDNESTSSSCLTSSESDDSEDENVSDPNTNPTDLPKEDYQALSLMSCFIRNKFSNSACKDVIDTLKGIFTSEEITSLNYNEMMSRIDLSQLHEVHYCSNCHTLFPEDREVFHCLSPNCNGLRYKGSLAAQTRKSRQPAQSFVFANLKAQLLALLEAPGIWKDILETKEEAFDRLESGSTVLTDITDGSAYRAMMVDGGFLDKTSHNLTAIFNTDGVKNLFTFSKIDLWPIFLAINELSPPKRFARENITLAGLWQGKGKPPCSQFFKVFADQMNSLYNDGIQIQTDEELLNIRLLVVCCIADLPAKAELLNMSYFNGPYACIKCEEPGITVKQGKGSAKCYPYKVHGNRSSTRNEQSLKLHMQSGTTNKRSCGFKGISALASLQNYNVVTGSVPEYMHGVLLGVTKTLLSRWFSASESKKDYYIGKYLKEISHLMKNLKPPEGIERLPRDLEKHYSHFKATELQSWLLYYAYPCVKDFLKTEYLENFSLLSEAVHILLRDAITHEKLAEATDLLDQFYASFQRLYGDGSCGLNVHNIGYHLSEYVRLWGPIWAWSAFPFEDSNAALLQSVHGTGTVLKQLMKHRQVQSFIRRKGIDLKKTVIRKITHEATNCNVLGAAKPLKPNQIENEVIEQINMVHNDVSKLKKVYRVIFNETIFYSQQYSRMQKRICSVVMYGNTCSDVGSIKYFILCNNVVYAVIQKMQQIPAIQIPGVRVANHYSAVRSTDVLSVIDVVNLKQKLVYLKTSENENIAYVVSMPNRYGHALFK